MMKPYRVRGWHVLAGMLAFFGAIIAVNVAFAVIAVRSFPGEDVRRSYLQGLRYNDTLASRRTQDALGWRVAAFFEDGRVVVSLRAASGAPVDAAVVSGALQRPTDARLDRALAFEQIGAGRYAAPAGRLAPGHWRLRGRGERGGEARDFEAELTWPASR